MEELFTIETFPYEKYFSKKILARKSGGQNRRSKVQYVDQLSAFDIETTTINKYDQSVMYVWQMCFEGIGTVIGRTWKEFVDFMQRLISVLKDDQYLVVYVHNLSYEFQFLRGIYNFNKDEVFAIDSRRILKCNMWKHVEFRCSYIHSNMSLAEYTNKMNVKHKKLSGEDFDYSIERYWFTPLTDKELEYCRNDVLGLVEALRVEMDLDNDNLYTIPLTSTGYVRRDVKQAMYKTSLSTLRDNLPDFEVYKALREAFRGGNTHANRYYAGDIIQDVKSYDRSSSYPDVQCNCKFPMSEFRKEMDTSFDTIIKLMEVKHRALLCRIAITNLRLVDKHWGCPYIPIDKARYLHKSSTINDNGRILSTEYMEMTVTDIDLRIIVDEYDFDDLSFIEVWSASYGKLPKNMTDVIKDYYTKKTELKGVAGQEVYYTKSKNKLNSVYGMSAQNPIKQSIIYIGGMDPFALDHEDEETMLIENNKKAFFNYAWGVWTTAWARYRLEEGIRLVHETAGARFLYTDTDSVKYVGDVDWTEYNKERERDSKENHAYATDPKGVTHYMGVYEFDGSYEKFITLGAKKYAYIEKGDDKIHLTVSGVNKKLGGVELAKYDGLNSFKPGFIFKEAGGNEVIYNDEPSIHKINVEGHEVDITPNIVIKDSTYTLGITADYAALLESCCRTGILI